MTAVVVGLLLNLQFASSRVVCVLRETTSTANFEDAVFRRRGTVEAASVNDFAEHSLFDFSKVLTYRSGRDSEDLANVLE